MSDETKNQVLSKIIKNQFSKRHQRLNLNDLIINSLRELFQTNPIFAKTITATDTIKAILELIKPKDDGFQLNIRVNLGGIPNLTAEHYTKPICISALRIELVRIN